MFLKMISSVIVESSKSEKQSVNLTDVEDDLYNIKKCVEWVRTNALKRVRYIHIYVEKYFFVCMLKHFSLFFIYSLFFFLRIIRNRNNVSMHGIKIHTHTHTHTHKVLKKYICNFLFITRGYKLLMKNDYF